MRPREGILVALAILGFAIPNALSVAFVVEHGLDLSAYFAAWVASIPAAQLASDLTIAFIAFALWAAWEGRRLRMRSWWLPIPTSLFVGLCFSIPLFLLLRERTIRQAGRARSGDLDPVTSRPTPEPDVASAFVSIRPGA